MTDREEVAVTSTKDGTLGGDEDTRRSEAGAESRGDTTGARSEEGLISVAGGWEGSEELVEILARNVRSQRRSMPRLR